MSGIGAAFAALNIVGKLTGAGALLKKIPPKAWLVIGCVVALVIGVIGHQVHAHKALKRADAAGYTRAMNDVAERQKKIDAAALKLKQKSDALNAKITQQEHQRYDQDAAHSHALADALRLRYGSPAGPPRGSGQAFSGVSRPAGAAGGSQPQADAGMATVPALPLIDYAEQCDDDHSARIRIEDWWKRIKESWPK